MLKNLHVITGIIFALTIFCLLQVVTGGLFYSAVNNDRHNFQNSGLLNAQQESLSDSVNTLVKTRVTVTRVAIRYLKNQRDPASLAAINTLLGTANGSLTKAEDYYKNWQAISQVKGQNAALTEEMQKARKQMHEVMRLSIEYLRADNYQAYGDLDAQQAQDEMEAVYTRWRAENNVLLKAAAEENQSSFTQMQWTLAAIFLTVIAVLVVIWQGLQHLLLKPLNAISHHEPYSHHRERRSDAKCRDYRAQRDGPAGCRSARDAAVAGEHRQRRTRQHRFDLHGRRRNCRRE